jgi:hypothetical protein
MRSSQVADDPILAVAVFAGLVLVVFLTYFVLAFAGLKSA